MTPAIAAKKINMTRFNPLDALSGLAALLLVPYLESGIYGGVRRARWLICSGRPAFQCIFVFLDDGSQKSFKCGNQEYP